MQQLSPSRRRRLIVAAAVLAAFLVALLGYFGWRRGHSPQEPYRDVVSAFYTGIIAMEVSDDEHALSGLTLATQLAPQEPAGWADLGVYYLRHNNFDSARQALNKAHDQAPKNAQILFLLGLLENGQFHLSEAIADYKQAIQLDPSDLRARYALEEAIQQQGGPDADTESLKQFQAIYQAAPDNLFAEFKLAGAAAKTGNAILLRQVVAQIAPHSATWSPQLKQDFQAAQTAAAGGDSRAAIGPLLGLQNELSPLPQFQEDAAKIQGDTSTQGAPLRQFLVLPVPPATPAAPDMTLNFTFQALTAPGAGPWGWAQTVALTPDAAPTLVVANGRKVQVGTVALAFPGGPKAVPPGPNGVLAFDANNDALMDFACAGAGGLRFYQQGAGGTLADVTAKSKLPVNVLSGSYTGVWTADIDTDGDLDLILGAVAGQPTVLRNNGDGTWNVLHPFAAAKNGLSQFVWADLDGDGSPDAAFLDGQGRLVVLQNKRSGMFTPWPIPADVGKVAALSAADVARDGTQNLVILTADSAVRRLSRRDDDGGWDAADLGHSPAASTDASARLQWADLDNNGALDLVVTSSQGTQVLLDDTQGKLTPLATPADARDVTVDAQATKGRLDLIGLNTQGQPIRLVNTGSKDYAWQEVRLRAATTGDKRNNTYGVGGEIGLRAGLLYETQLVSGPITHFGLGDYKRADAIRILWPNGSPQGEFELKANQLAEAPERLKGSCPWLFADDGVGMKFVTDFIWRSPLGLRINAQDTAGVVQTRDWVKVRGDQLKARDGFYNLSITADLWETHYFDEIKLMAVDHPVGTDVFVDERFSIPPPPLALNTMTQPHPIA